MLALFVAAVLSAPEAELQSPATGSVDGAWALLETALEGAAVSTSGGHANLHGTASFVAGVGLDVFGVRLSPTIDFTIGPRLRINQAGLIPSLEWSALTLALAFPDLLNDRRFTGLRLTPVLGMTVPTASRSFDGGLPLTTISTALQLERRFGSLELAYRLGGARSLCAIQGICVASWDLDNRLLIEGWIRPDLSLAFGAAGSMKWLVLQNGVAPTGCIIGDTCDLDVAPAQQPNALASARGMISWAFSERFGTTLELNGSIAPGRSHPSATAGATLSLWFRSDRQLRRNWLDR